MLKAAHQLCKLGKLYSNAIGRDDDARVLAIMIGYMYFQATPVFISVFHKTREIAYWHFSNFVHLNQPQPETVLSETAPRLSGRFNPNFNQNHK